MGIVWRLSVKGPVEGGHGLSKPAVAIAQLAHSGFVGDFNRYRHETNADDPDSAVLIIPEETLLELQSEGWPVQPGDLGENLTTHGIPYGDLLPGRGFRVGEAVIRVTRPCDPWTNLYLLPYVGHDRGPEFLKTTLGRRGWYAKVEAPGTVRQGDEFRPA
jgi:MOSC domain-containing protein YiiM